MTSTLWLIVLAGALSIVYGIVTTRGLLAADAGSARMQEISAAVREGAAAFRAMGTEQSTGTKLYCLSGHVNKPGNYEAVMGAITLRQLDRRVGTSEQGGGVSG